MSSAVLEAGAVPAWIWIDLGAIRVGAEPDDLARLCGSDRVAKVARRDLPMAVASGGLGATTVSATLWAAARAGIDVMATGGIGGVHLGSGDVSADLLEMARIPGTVVCSGPKSIVDPAATLEKLEELGVAVVGYECDRLPFFLVRETDLSLEHRADEPGDVARLAMARSSLGIDSAILVCNPIRAEDGLDRTRIEAAVHECVERAGSEGIAGKAVTPFLLSCLADATEGASLEANLSLLRDNAALAARIAKAMS
jgi:pseudouridine-5'-phosphate glycosidase